MEKQKKGTPKPGWMIDDARKYFDMTDKEILETSYKELLEMIKLSKKEEAKIQSAPKKKKQKKKGVDETPSEPKPKTIRMYQDGEKFLGLTPKQIASMDRSELCRKISAARAKKEENKN